jgi:ABC-type transport system substrate-binding protein
LYWFSLIFICVSLLWAKPHYVDKPLEYSEKNTCGELLHVKHPSSHIKVYLPSIPYTYVSRLINGSLLRVNDNAKGWEYMMATRIEQIDALTYDAYLRKGVRFQDGTPFNAQSVVRNFNQFIAHPFTYTDIHNRLKSVERRDAYTVRFHLHKPYGMFLHDLASINLYSDAYLKKFGWKGDATGDSMAEPGLYGLGPYILHKGYATGRKQTKEIVLKANPNYYEKGKPYIETITIFTELKSDEAVHSVLNKESLLDIASLPFNKKAEAVLSPFSKLAITPSFHNYTLYLNLLKPQGAFQDKAVRQALNKALDRTNLLNFVYKKEGRLSPSAASVNFAAIEQSSRFLQHPPAFQSPNNKEKQVLKDVLEGLTLNVLTQDRFMFLWRGIEYQLQEYGVRLKFTITQSEKTIYENLLTNRDAPKQWDILTWGNDDWYGNHPWTVFFAYRPGDDWSMINKDDTLSALIQELFETSPETTKHDKLIATIVSYAQDQAYLLTVPSPHLVLAINKEIAYAPSASAIMPLWEAKISSLHWSVREGKYPASCQTPFLPQRMSP